MIEEASLEDEQDMSEQIPNQSVLEAFGLSGAVTLLEGGQGTCYQVGNVVLKSIKDTVEESWIAEVTSGLSSDKFRVAAPIRSKDGSWVFENWIANELLEGEHRSGHYAEAIELSRNFHHALKDIPRPDWFDEKTDVFAISDRMAWGELELPDYESSKRPFTKIFNLLKENKLPNQVVHGDWGTGQILYHDTLPPAVLDITPYFRPADYPIADMLISAMIDEDAEISVLDLAKDIEEIDQLLLRALLFRTCTYIGFQIHPDNNYDWIPVIQKHFNLVDPIINKIKQFK